MVIYTGISLLLIILISIYFNCAYSYLHFIGIYILFTAIGSNYDFHVSLFASIVTLFLYTFFKYNTKNNSKIVTMNSLVASTLLATIIAYIAKNQGHTTWLHICLFSMVVYIICSILEWLLHKYVMHCYMYWPWLETMNNSSLLPIRFMNESCKSHHKHHQSVKSDMNIDDENVVHRELLFRWDTLSVLALLTIVVIISFTFLLRIKVKWYLQVSIILFTLIIYGYVWNTIHPKIHNRNVNVDMKFGPQNLDFDVLNLYHRNHETHHLVKGIEKGNFNVVFLGADELLLSNNILL